MELNDCFFNGAKLNCRGGIIDSSEIRVAHKLDKEVSTFVHINNMEEDVQFYLSGSHRLNVGENIRLHYIRNQYDKINDISCMPILAYELISNEKVVQRMCSYDCEFKTEKSIPLI